MYEETDLERLTFIRRGRDFGFSIDEVRELAGLSISTDRDCSEVRYLAHVHLAEVRAKLPKLKALEASLEAFAKQCDTACADASAWCSRISCKVVLQEIEPARL